MKVTIEVTEQVHILSLLNLLANMPGSGLPVAAEEPQAEPAKRGRKSKEETPPPPPAATETPAAPEITFDVVRTRLVAISTKGKEHNKAVREAVAKANDTGAPKEQSLSDVDPKFFPGLVKWADEYEASISI